MKNLVFVILAVGVAIVLAWVIRLVTPQEHYRVYDCSLADIHPDYPPQVREECRRIQANQKNYI